MLEYFKYFVFAYLGFYVLLHIALRGKVTIGFISWLHLINVHINLEALKVSIKSVSVQIRPMYYLHRKKLKATHHDGLIVVHFYSLKLFLLDVENSTSTSTSTASKAPQQQPPSPVAAVPNGNAVGESTAAVKLEQQHSIDKTLKVLQWLRYILPLTVVIHNLDVIRKDTSIRLETLSLSFNCDMETNRETKQRELRNSIHISISNLSDAHGKMVKDLKWTIVGATPLASACTPHFSKFVSSCVGHGVSIDIDELKQLVKNLTPKRSRNVGEENPPDKSSEHEGKTTSTEKKKRSFEDYFNKFDKCDVYFAVDELHVKSGESQVCIKNFVHAINSADKKDMVYKKYSGSKLYKLTTNVSGLTFYTETFKNSKLRVEFLNFLSIWDFKALIFSIENIHNSDVIKQFTHDDSFIARSFFTVTNTTLFTNLEDIIAFKELKKLKALRNKTNKNRGQNSASETVPEAKEQNSTAILDNILRLTHRMRTRAQLLTSMLQVRLSDTIISQFLIDDILVDSSLTDNLASLFEMDNYLTPTKSIFVAVRNIQFSIIEHSVVHKLLVMDLFDASCSIAVNDDTVVIDTISLYTHHIEFLAEDINIFKQLALIANEVVNRKPSAVAEEIKVLEELAIEIQVEDKEKKENSDARHTEHKPRKCSMLPKCINSFKFLIHRITLTSCFKNPVKYWDGEDQTSINNFKRGISLSFLEFNINHDNTVDIPVSDIRLSDFTVSLIRDYDHEKHVDKFPKIVSVQNTHVKYTYLNNRLSLVFPIFDIMLSVEVLWTVIFILTVLKSLGGRKKDEKHTFNKKDANLNEKKPAYPLNILVAFPLIMLKLKLPSDVDLAFEIDSLQYTKLPSATKSQNIRVKVFRIYGQNAHAEGFWTLLAIVTNGNFIIIPKEFIVKNEEQITVHCEDIRVEIPYEYVFYKTFDNLKAFFKSIKKLRVNFHDLMFIENTNKDFKVGVIMPSLVDSPPRFPKVRVKSKRILYCNHDDPFEEEITAFVMLAKMEQQVRLSKQRAFEKYETKMLLNLEEKYRNVLRFENGVALMPAALSKGVRGGAFSSTGSVQMKKSLSTGLVQLQSKNEGTVTVARSKLANEILTEECEAWLGYQREYHTSIEIPRNRLNANISKSWISRVKATQRMKKCMGSTDGGVKADPKVRKEFLKKFPVVVEGSSRALFGFKVLDAIVDLDEPEFGLENYPDFLHRVAGGMPRDMKYGILVPMNLKLWCSEVKVQIKDYPLPLVGFGGGKGDGSDAVQFAGDMVICEQKYSLEEIRYNFVPCVPQYDDKQMRDSLYAFHVARTMTNVKFVTDMDVFVDSSKAAAVSWAPSLQPGMSYAFNSFDLLSKPPLDISPKLGFWDKMPLLVPSKFTFTLKNGIALFIKASQSPYHLIGRNAGFAFKWDKDVKISINKKDKPEDFLIVESQVFEIGVPVFDPEYISSLMTNGMGTPLDFKISKVLLRLTSTPIVWKLGFLFERNLNNEKHVKPGSVERTKFFRPHYDVQLRNPDTFGTDEERETWDSYEGWRSDYIYLAVSLYSRDDNKCHELPKSTAGSAFNSLYLTPMAMFYFFFWWDSFKSSLGLPIKTGKLFRNKFLVDSKSPKFGASIFGLTYTVDLSPLYLTHVYQHSSVGHDSSKVAFTGMKCFVKSFTMDLHQCRREVVTVDDKTKTALKEYHLQMDKGVVDFVDADLRVLTAVFNQTSATGMLVKQLGLEKSSTTFTDDSSSATSGEYMDRVWYDHNDFIELETQAVPDEEPKWKVYELASTPRFYYVRDAGSSQVDFPFDVIETQTHNCQLGNRDFSHAASHLADARIEELEDQITFHKSEIEDLKSKPINKFVEKTLAGLDADLQELHHRLHVLRCLKDKFSEGVFPEYDEFLDDQEESDDEVKYELSKIASRVSSHISRSKSRISTAQMQTSNYINRFSIYTINIKWTKQSKSGFLRYLEKVKDRRFLVFSMSQQALSLAKAVQKSAEQFVEEDPDLSFLRNDPQAEFEKSKCLLDDFDQALHDTTGYQEAETEDSFLLKLILPQIAISTDSNKCVLLTSNQIVLRSVTVKGYQADSNFGEISMPCENRNGLILTDAFLYVLDRENIFNNKHSFFNPKTFSWPPKLPIEMYYTPVSLDECVVVQDISCALLFVKPNELRYTTNGNNKNVRRKETVRIIAPEVNVTTDSVQLEVLKNVFTSMFENDQTEIHKIKESVKNFIKYSDFSDFTELSVDLRDLQAEARQLLQCRRLIMNFNYSEDIDVVDDVESINIELEKVFLNLNAIVDIMQTSKTKKYNDLHEFTQWNVMAPIIKLQLVDENKTPFVEVSAIDSYYMFTDSSNGESTNTAYVYDFAVFDKHPKAEYEMVLTRLDDSRDPLFRMDWTLLAPVGGIKIVEQKSFSFAPLKVEFDMRFAEALQEFLFPKSKVLQNSQVLNDSDSDDLLDEIESINSDATSLQRVDSSSSVSTVEKQGSKISRAFHKLLPKHSSKSENSSFLPSVSNPSTEEGTVSFTNNVNISKQGKSKSENLKLMDKRAATYYMAKQVKIDQMRLSITFRGAGKLRIINLSDFFIEVPMIEVRNKIMSNEELFAILRNKIVHYVLRNTHNIIKSTLKTSKSSKGASSNPLINPVLKMRAKSSKRNEEEHIHRDIVDPKHGKVHGHKHHAEGSKFHDTDLLEPKIGNGFTALPPKRLVTLNELVEQDKQVNNNLDDAALYQSLDDVQEEDEEENGTGP